MTTNTNQERASMKLYCVFQEFDHDGSELMAIYSDAWKAEQAMQELQIKIPWGTFVLDTSYTLDKDAGE